MITYVRVSDKDKYKDFFKKDDYNSCFIITLSNYIGIKEPIEKAKYFSKRGSNVVVIDDGEVSSKALFDGVADAFYIDQKSSK